MSGAKQGRKENLNLLLIVAYSIAKIPSLEEILLIKSINPFLPTK